MIAQELEVSLHQAFVEARHARYEFVTVEHLLLALLDNASAARALRACAGNLEDLRQSLERFVSDNTPVLPHGSETDTQPTLGFQRVIQRAIMQVQATYSGKKAVADAEALVTGADVLLAIFSEKDSHAVYYLHQQGLTRLDVVNFLSNGVSKSVRGGQTAQIDSAGHPQGAQGTEPSPTLESLIVQSRDGKMHPLIGRAIMEARQARHEFVTVEHLLLGLLEDASAVQGLRAWACNVEELRKTLVSFLSESMPVLPRASGANTRAIASFIRVIQRAVMRAMVRDVQSAPAGKTQLASADVLAAIFDEEDSYAAYCLRRYTENLNLLADDESGRLFEQAMHRHKQILLRRSQVRSDDAGDPA